MEIHIQEWLLLGGFHAVAVEEVKVKWQPPSPCVERVVSFLKVAACFLASFPSLCTLVQEMCLLRKYLVVMQSRCGLFCWIGDSLRHLGEIA